MPIPQEKKICGMGILPVLAIFARGLLYIRLAHQEERDAIAEFGDEYARYAAATPAFLPWGRRSTQKKVSRLEAYHHDP